MPKKRTKPPSERDIPLHFDRSTKPRMKRNENSAYNAFRHGLASKSNRHTDEETKITLLAKIMCRGEDNALLFQQAFAVAECDIAISEIRKYKNRLLARLQDPDAFPTRYARKERKHRLEQHERKSENGKLLVASFVGTNAPPEASAKFDQLMKEYWSVERDRGPDDVWAEALPELMRVSRYERRAWSRRRRAFMRFLALMSGFDIPTPASQIIPNDRKGRGA